LRSPADAINHGIGYVSEDRYLEGLFPQASIPFNITSPDFALNEANPLINRAKESLTAQKFVHKLLIHTRSIFSRIAELSGGNQQKVLLAKWIYSRSDILILDEPTRGIDVASKVDLYNILNEMLRRDVSIILISSDIDEIVGLCDRILVLYGGEIAATIQFPFLDTHLSLCSWAWPHRSQGFHPKGYSACNHCNRFSFRGARSLRR